jgi:hypothetical protein
VGGVALGEVVPGGVIADFPEDSIQNRTGLDGGTADNFQGAGILVRIVISDYGLDEVPLLIGEVHDVIQNLYPLLSMSGQTMGIYVPQWDLRDKLNCANFKYIFITSFLQPLIFEIMALSELKKCVAMLGKSPFGTLMIKRVFVI